MTTVVLTIAFGLTLLALFFVMALYWQHDKEIEDLQKHAGDLTAENKLLISKVRHLEKRQMEECDKIEIVHKYDDSSAPTYGGF